MPRLATIYLVHHSHTDVGFAADQPVFWELQARFIGDPLNTIERMQGGPTESHFRWTRETTAPVLKWLETASERDTERFVRADQSGHLEVSAMLVNAAPLHDRAQYAESLRTLPRLRGCGLDIRHAMQSDVNGQPWSLTDVLLDAGIEGFSLAINHHFGGAPPRPAVFGWQAPSGRILPTFNGWTYPRAREFGIGEAADGSFALWLGRLQVQLDQVQYPLPFLMLQGDHPYGGNASVYPDYARFARRWNASGRGPQLIMATPRMFWRAVQEHGSHRQGEVLQARRGDWSDYWNFGYISTARETGIAQTSRARLWSADALYAGVQGLPTEPKADGPGADGQLRTCWAGRSFPLYWDAAWHSLNLWGEHTWGADLGVGRPDHEDALAQKTHKLKLAYTADTPSGWQPGWAARRTPPAQVISHSVLHIPPGIAVEQHLEHPHVCGLSQPVFLPAHTDWTEYESSWTMNQDAHPQATYLVFPFALPGATVRLNLAGQPVIPCIDQLPSVCRDYFTVQDWADFGDGDCDMRLALPINPLVQLGGFHIGKLFLGWVTNNYWETNFQPVQPGLVTARYRLEPYAGRSPTASGPRRSTRRPWYSAPGSRRPAQHCRAAARCRACPCRPCWLHI